MYDEYTITPVTSESGQTVEGEGVGILMHLPGRRRQLTLNIMIHKSTIKALTTRMFESNALPYSNLHPPHVLWQQHLPEIGSGCTATESPEPEPV
jgi:hypothetical protein